MKKLIPVIMAIMLFVSGCGKIVPPNDTDTDNKQVITDNGDTFVPEKDYKFGIGNDEVYYIGLEDLEFGYKTIVFYNNDTTVAKSFENAVVVNERMGTLDKNKPVIIGVLDETKRDGATAIMPDQFTYGVYSIATDTWLVPLQYNSIAQYKNGYYGAILEKEEDEESTEEETKEDTEEDSIKMQPAELFIYSASGELVKSGIDVTNCHVENVGNYIWTISYEEEQPIQIYDENGEYCSNIDKSYGTVHNKYFVSSDAERGDTVYDARGTKVITKESVVERYKDLGKEEGLYYIVNFDDTSNLIEAKLGDYKLVQNIDGTILYKIDQEVEPNRDIVLDSGVFCVKDMKEDGNELTEQDTGIITNKEDIIYVDGDANYSYFYDKEGKHILTQSGEEYQGHVQPFGLEYVPSALFHVDASKLEIYDYEEDKSYYYQMKDIGIVELKAILKDFYLITNEMEAETQNSLYYKNMLLVEGTDIDIQIVDKNLVVTEYSKEYESGQKTIIYDKQGKVLYSSETSETIERVEANDLLVTRDGKRMLIDYKGNCKYLFELAPDIQS